MRIVIASLAFVASTFASAIAGEISFPKSGEAMFKMTIPDSWESDKDNDDVVEATSPENNIALSIWEIDSDTQLETVTNDMQDILKDYAEDVKLDGEPKKLDVDGLPGLFLTGSGKDAEDDREVGFIAFILVKETKAAIIFFEVDSNYSKNELKKFESILESIHVPASN